MSNSNIRNRFLRDLFIRKKRCEIDFYQLITNETYLNKLIFITSNLNLRKFNDNNIKYQLYHYKYDFKLIKNKCLKDEYLISKNIFRKFYFNFKQFFNSLTRDTYDCDVFEQSI